MKTLATILIICSSQIIIAQKTQEKDSSFIRNNIMDTQATIITKIFGSNLDGNPDGTSLNFSELIEKSDASPELKKHAKETYFVQSKNLTEKQKDSLDTALGKQIMNARKETKKKKKN